MVSKELVEGVTVSKSAKFSFCEGCVEGKMHRKPFKPVGEILSKRKLQCVHSDVCGPMPKESIGGGNTLSRSLMTIPDVVRFTL